MNSRTKRFLPRKIERKKHPDYTKLEEFDSIIRDAFEMGRKLSSKRAADNRAEKYLPYAYQGQTEKKRREVLRRSLADIMPRFIEKYKGQIDPYEAMLSWIELNAPMVSYTKLEQRYHVLFGAAIWILDRITEQEDWRKKLFPLLPQNDRETEEFFEPDVWDCQYEYDLITSVVSVFYYRNLDVSKGGGSGHGKKAARADTEADDSFEARLRLMEDHPHVLTSEYAASRGLDADWREKPEPDKRRERFRALLALIPQEQIDEMVQQFRKTWDQWINFFFDGLIVINKDRESLDQQKSAIAEEHNQIVDELEILIDKAEDKRRSRTVRKDGKNGMTKNQAVLNPLLNTNKAMADIPIPSIEQFIKSQAAASGAVNLGIGFHERMVPGMGLSSGSRTGDAELDAQMQRMESLYMKCEALEERFDNLIDESNEIYSHERVYSLLMAGHGRISYRHQDHYATLPASVKEPIRFSDVYGLCFAFLYLIELRDDIVWLYGAAHGLMAQVCESLPWGMREYDEIGDPVWDEENDAEDVPKTAAVPDWDERKYAEKDPDYYFPRSLSQILYEETGCILPRDIRIYYPEYETIRDYGIKGKDAGVMMLMAAALSTARRQVRASNFDASYARLLEEENGEPGEEKEIEKEEADGGADQAAESLRREEDARGQAAAVKDDRDVLIDQLRDALKKAQASIHTAEAETRNTRKELNATKSIYEREHRELADLREIVFNAQFSDAAGDLPQPSAASAGIEYPYETARRTTVFGGHDTFLKAIKPMLPNVRFIDASYMTFSPELVRNSDIVWIQTNCISHPMFWNVIRYAKQYGIQLRYFTQASAEKCADQVVETDRSYNSRR